MKTTLSYTSKNMYTQSSAHRLPDPVRRPRFSQIGMHWFRGIALLLFIIMSGIFNLVFAEPCPVVGNTSDLLGAGPDLQLELISIEPHPGVSEELTSAHVSIKNTGSKPVTDAFTAVLCVDGLIENSMQWEPMPGEQEELAAGSSIPFYSYLSLPPGIHTLRWTVDSGESIAETAEQNNTLDMNETWVTLSQGPDLVVQNIFTRVPEVQADGKVNINPMANYLHAQKVGEIVVRIANTGKNGTNEDVTVRVTVPFDSDQEVQVAFFTLKGLVAGGHQDFAFLTQTVRADTVEKFTAYVDVGNTIVETNEENNSLSLPFEVRSANLVIENLLVNPIRVGLEGSVSIRFRVRNKGNADVPTDTCVRVQPGRNEEGGLTPVYMEVPALAAGKSIQLSHNYKPVVLAEYEVALEVNPPEQRRWPEQSPGQRGKTAFSQFKVVPVGPRINRFEVTVLDDERARLDWEVLCRPECSVRLDHLYYTDGPWQVPLRGSREVERDRNIHDGTYELIAKRGSASVSMKVDVPKWIGSQQPGLVQKPFYFKLTNPGSWVNPCFVTMVYAPDEKTAKKRAQAQAMNYQIMVITKEQYHDPNTCRPKKKNKSPT